MIRMRITGEGTINDRHSGEQLGPVFRQEDQSASTDREHQVGRTLPIFPPKKISLPLLLLLARKTGHIEELTVTLDTLFGGSREGRADGLIHDDIGRQQPLIRIEHEYALDRCRSLPGRSGAGQVENQEHGGAETEKSHNRHRRLRPIFSNYFGRKRHGFSGLGNSAPKVLSKHAKPSNTLSREFATAVSSRTPCALRHGKSFLPAKPLLEKEIRGGAAGVRACLKC